MKYYTTLFFIFISFFLNAQYFSTHENNDCVELNWNSVNSNTATQTKYKGYKIDHQNEVILIFYDFFKDSKLTTYQKKLLIAESFHVDLRHYIEMLLSDDIDNFKIAFNKHVPVNCVIQKVINWIEVHKPKDKPNHDISFLTFDFMKYNRCDVNQPSFISMLPHQIQLKGDSMSVKSFITSPKPFFETNGFIKIPGEQVSKMDSIFVYQRPMQGADVSYTYTFDLKRHSFTLTERYGNCVEVLVYH